MQGISFTERLSVNFYIQSLLNNTFFTELCSESFLECNDLLMIPILKISVTLTGQKVNSVAIIKLDTIII